MENNNKFLLNIFQVISNQVCIIMEFFLSCDVSLIMISNNKSSTKQIIYDIDPQVMYLNSFILLLSLFCLLMSCYFLDL
jgi:predicted DNA-binding protein YlxM (UPF0122 family)